MIFKGKKLFQTAIFVSCSSHDFEAYGDPLSEIRRKLEGKKVEKTRTNEIKSTNFSGGRSVERKTSVLTSAYRSKYEKICVTHLSIVV